MSVRSLLASSALENPSTTFGAIQSTSPVEWTALPALDPYRSYSNSSSSSGGGGGGGGGGNSSSSSSSSRLRD